MDPQKLREQRASLWSQMQANLAVTERTGELDQAYDRMENECDSLDAQITRVERHEARDTHYDQVDRTGVIPPQGGAPVAEKAHAYSSAFRAYLASGIGGLDQDQRSILQEGFSTLQNALGTGTTAGGYTIPQDFRDELIIQMKAYGAVQEVAQVIETESGAKLPWPTMNDTTNVGRLLAENTQLTETDLVFGTKDIDAYVYSSDLTRVSLQLAQDSAFDIGAIVRAAHAERLGRITNQHFTTGTGTSQPDGIVTSATSGVTAAGVAAITSDELIDLVHSVDPAYRASPRAMFMLSDTALKVVRKLKDSNGMYLWQPNVQAGVAQTLHGYPYVINNDMAVPATGVKSVLFGDFYAGYVIRMVRDIQTITFTERYMDFLQLGHTSFLRADGTQQNASAYKALTQA